MDFVNKTTTVLDDNFLEWETLWNSWADGLDNRKDFILKARELFHEPSPLRIYLPIREAIASSNRCNFSIRYQGADIAQLLIEAENQIPKLIINGKDHFKRNREKLGIFEKDFPSEKYLWDSKDGKRFRSILRNHFKKESHENEHALESLILDEMESKNSEEKFMGTFKNIRPVKLYDKLRFQMKVPVSGSSGLPAYSTNGKGGSVDILARIHSVSNTNLAVLELKKDKASSYKKAIAQSIMYSVGIIKILRNSQKGRLWWNLFGFKRDLPDALKIHSVVVIPESIAGQYMKEKDQLGIKDKHEINIGNDTIQCGHIFFEKTNVNRIKITESNVHL